MPKVLVSGANGFIGQHIIEQLLQKGYIVIGTVRSEEKAVKLNRLFQNRNLQLEIVSDLGDLDAFDSVFAEHGKALQYVIHTASPCHYNSSDHEKDMLNPSINGTKAIFRAIKKYAPDSVQHVVYTSSFAAISNVTNAYDRSRTLTEASWNEDSWDEAKKNAKSAYYGSKAFAERAAWCFLRENANDIKFNLTTVNPCYVFGPQLFDESVTEKLNASCENINEILNTRPGDHVDQEFASYFIDVRDVAKAHVLALEEPLLAGKRLSLANTKFSFQDIVDAINESFPRLEITQGFPHSGSTAVANIASLDNSNSKELLGFQFKPLQETIFDTVTQILRVRNSKNL